MSLPHHEPLQFEFAKRQTTFAYRARVRPKSLVVFVHGFTGDPISTWEGFGSALFESAAFAKSDLVFYGYDSVYKQAIANANYFRQFMEAAGQTTPVANAQFQQVRDAFAGRAYARIVIACHSLGAVVVRRAVLDCVKEARGAKRRPCWAASSWMLLFGPAHSGGRPIKLALAAMHNGTSILPAMGAVGQYLVPALEDLKPGSRTLSDLAADTGALRSTGLVSAKEIAFGMDDNVVYRDALPGDPPANDYAGEDHVSICKLRARFREPLRIVERALP